MTRYNYVPQFPKQGATRSKKQTCMGEMSIKGYIQKNGPFMPCFLASKLWSFLGVILLDPASISVISRDIIF